MNITQKTDICTGCGMCTAICPSSAIQMQVDSHGFLHPAVDAGKCADCSLCAQKCPISAPPQRQFRSFPLFAAPSMFKAGFRRTAIYR